MRRQVNIKRNPIQSLYSCIPGCFRLVQKNFIRIEDVVPKNTEKGLEPYVLKKPGSIGNFSINQVSWRYIWNEIYQSGIPSNREKRLLPIIEDNKFIGSKTLKDCMDFCSGCWDYYPHKTHKCNKPDSQIKKVRYMQNPCRVNYHLVPEFSSGTLYSIFKKNEEIDFPNKKEILDIFESEESLDKFDSLVSAVLEANSDDSYSVYSFWSKDSPTEDMKKFASIRKKLGEKYEEFIKWINLNLSGEDFKKITHSPFVARREGRNFFKSNNVTINYCDDMNITRFVYDLERYPIGQSNKRPTPFHELRWLPFRNHNIDCIAASSRVESLILCFSDQVDKTTIHTYVHALTLYLSDKFKISKGIISHHIDDYFSLVFIDQPINLGILTDISKKEIEKFHNNYCNGENMCIDRGACPGACHHCLHFPNYSCPNSSDMKDMDWNKLGEVRW